MNVWLPAVALPSLYAVSVSEYGAAIGIAFAVVGAITAGRSKTWHNEAEAQKARGDRLDQEIAGLQERADREHVKRTDAENRAAKLEGQLEELRPYGEAFMRLSETIQHTESVLGTALEQLGNLVMESTAVASQSVKALEQITADLAKIREDFGRFAQRLGAGGDRPAELP